MVYFIIWAVILLGCIIALPVASMMDKRKLPSAPVYGSDFGEDEPQGEYESYEDAEPAMVDDGFGGDQEFPAEAMPDLDQPVGEDFSAFDEEFN